jgi:hypothetical protein
MTWSLLIEAIRPHVVKISTPDGYGTGFLAFYNNDKSWCGIATAAHVVGHADEWQQLIRITHQPSETEAILPEKERVVLIDHLADSAVILFRFENKLQLPQIPITLLPESDTCGFGVDVGWLGYPSVEPDALCFFSGAISARVERRRAYLIDGVAINGVSGGPVFHTSSSGKPEIIGCVSAYHPNRATGGSLPGLLRAQDLSHFHMAAATIRNAVEAQ